MERSSVARLGVLAAAFLFSTGGAAVKASSLTGWQVASLRSGVAVVALLVLLPEARRRWRRGTFLVGIAYAATLLLFVLANKLTTAASTIFLQSTSPLWILLAAPFLLGERIRRLDVAYMLALAGGMALLLAGSDPASATAPDPAAGDRLAALAGVTWALTVMGLRGLARSGTGEGAGEAGGDEGTDRGAAEGQGAEPAGEAKDGATASKTGAGNGEAPAGAAGEEGAGGAAPAVVAGNLLAFLGALPAALAEPEVVARASAADWGIVAFLGVFQVALAYVFLTRAVRHLEALETSLLLLLEPVANPLWAWLVHAERPAALSLAGGAVLLVATALKTWIESRSAAHRR